MYGLEWARYCIVCHTVCCTEWRRNMVRRLDGARNLQTTKRNMESIDWFNSVVSKVADVMYNPRGARVCHVCLPGVRSSQPTFSPSNPLNQNNQSVTPYTRTRNRNRIHLSSSCILPLPLLHLQALLLARQRSSLPNPTTTACISTSCAFAPHISKPRDRRRYSSKSGR